ncbi:MAG TPA: 23S rRNA (guanosine(2251)-2'-O)-methyltransferase RlmB [Stellaceae bacterium]|nr:23S rRNA (guanosine(2251)-2'-O)-methyltransferase RlmB [Stellaceae bacterium]
MRAGSPAGPERRGKPPAKERGAAPGATWLYGRHAVAAALANPSRRIRRIVTLRELEAELAPLLAAARADLPAAPEFLDRRALALLLPEDAVHQGIAASVDPLPRRELDDIIAALPEDAAPAIVVVLDQVSDPHNVGAILRSAAAFAALAVVVPEHGSPPVTGVLAKAASGALETVPLIRAGNLARALERLKQSGFWCIGLEEGAAQSLAALDLPQRCALVLGAEGGGLRRLTRERCDFLVRLAAGSLNVSNAAAVALYAIGAAGKKP